MFEKVLVIGGGYVGLSSATLISTKLEVCIGDIDQFKINKINNRISPIKDREIELFFKDKYLNLNAQLVNTVNYTDYDLILLCLPIRFVPKQ